MKYHLMFKNFHVTTTTATSELMGARPHEQNPEETHKLYETWLKKVSGAYGVPTPRLEYRQGGNVQLFGSYRVRHDGAVITLPKYTLIGLFHQFRHHMQSSGLAENCYLNDPEDVEKDANGWAYSLYYQVKPFLFRRLVRSGRIPGMHPSMLLRNPEEYVEPTVEEVAEQGIQALEQFLAEEAGGEET